MVSGDGFFPWENLGEDDGDIRAEDVLSDEELEQQYAGKNWRR